MIKKILNSELGKGTLILLITINIFNVLNFLFHFAMGRFLGPAEYGTLAVLMSLVYIFGIPSEAIQNLISKYTSQFNLKKENRKIKYLMSKSLKKASKFSLAIFLTALVIAWPLSWFLKINYWLIALTNAMLFSSFAMPIVRGILQGRKKFTSLGIDMVLDSLLKLGIAILLVFLGFKVFGAMAGVLAGTVLGFIMAVYFNKDILKEKEEKASFDGIYIQSVPYFIAMIVILFMFSMDIILAKRFFSPDLAGQYSVLSMLGKIIFFGTLAVSKAMFPLTSEKSERKKESQKLFKKSFLTVAGLCIIATGIFAFFPKLVIGILYGSQYVSMAPYLIYSAIALSFLSLNNLILIYSLSINTLKKSYYLFAFLILEIILLVIFHANILEYILAFMFSNIVMFIFSFLFLKVWKN